MKKKKTCMRGCLTITITFKNSPYESLLSLTNPNLCREGGRGINLVCGKGRGTTLQGGSASFQGHILSREKTGNRAKQHTSNRVVIASSSLTSRWDSQKLPGRLLRGGGRKGKRQGRCKGGTSKGEIYKAMRRVARGIPNECCYLKSN